jgi:hypothetical protein
MTASPRASVLQSECLLALVTSQMQVFLSSEDAQCVDQPQHTAVGVCGLERRGDCQACCPLLRAQRVVSGELSAACSAFHHADLASTSLASFGLGGRDSVACYIRPASARPVRQRVPLRPAGAPVRSACVGLVADGRPPLAAPARGGVLRGRKRKVTFTSRRFPSPK